MKQQFCALPAQLLLLRLYFDPTEQKTFRGLITRRRAPTTTIVHTGYWIRCMFIMISLIGRSPGAVGCALMESMIFKPDTTSPKTV